MRIGESLTLPFSLRWVGWALGRVIQYSMSEYSLTFSSRWRAVTWRTVPDFDRITSDSVVAP